MMQLSDEPLCREVIELREKSVAHEKEIRKYIEKTAHLLGIEKDHALLISVNEKLRAENARLREALVKISTDTSQVGLMRPYTAGAMIARKALEKK